MENKLPEYVIEESVPRFSGIDIPTIAYVECKFLNMDGNFIMSKTSKPDYDELRLVFNNTMGGLYDITLCSDKMYREIKDSYERNNDFDEVDGMLTTYRHSITTGKTYVTSVGFEHHFKIRSLRKDFGIDIEPIYKFDASKFQVNDVFKITSGKCANGIQYGILMTIRDTSLIFKMPSNPYCRDDRKCPYEYVCDIKWVVDGSVKLERVDL